MNVILGSTFALFRARCRAKYLAGSGRGSTWRYRKFGIAHRLPGFRIDHVFIGPELTCTNSRVLDPFGSDDRAIVADIAWATTDNAEAGERVALTE